MLSLVMRPLLMLMGFVSGMLVLYVTSLLVGMLFPIAMTGIMGDHNIGPASFIGLMAIFAGVMIGLCHQSFALSHVVPDKILRWIGGGQEMLGEGQYAQMAQGAMQRTQGTVSDAVTRGGAAVVAAGAFGKKGGPQQVTLVDGEGKAVQMSTTPSQHAATDAPGKGENPGSNK